MLLQIEKRKLIQGLKFIKEVIISHILFADYNLIFTKASAESCKHRKTIFECYASTSGQVFNYDKSSMFCSDKIPERQVAAIKDIV